MVVLQNHSASAAHCSADNSMSVGAENSPAVRRGGLAHHCMQQRSWWPSPGASQPPCESSSTGGKWWRCLLGLAQGRAGGRFPSVASAAGRGRPSRGRWSTWAMCSSLFWKKFTIFYAQNAAYSLQHPPKKNQPDKLNLRGKQDPSIGIKNIIINQR
jgi:hypothetical protein